MKNILKLLVLIPFFGLLYGCNTLGGHKTAHTTTANTAPAVNTAPVAQYGSDAWVTSKVKAKYAADTKLRSWNIQVSTEKGHTVLTGSVPTCRMKQRAYLIALCRTKGVKSVDVSNLTNKDGKVCPIPSCRVLHHRTHHK